MNVTGNVSDNRAETVPEHSIEELEKLVALHAKTRAMNKNLSPVLVKPEAEAIVALEAAKAERDAEIG